LGIAKSLPLQQKYNAAQQVSYSAIVVMGALSVMSGLAIYKPAQLGWLTALFGGYGGARLVHFALTIGYLLFFAVHLAQVLRAGWNNFRGMVIGYELAGDK
jgi:thiosulfate reductase cytochrome b subunit